MAKKTIQTNDPDSEESEQKTKLYYEINTHGGDLYLTINAGRNSEVKVMSGQPTNPNQKPPGGS